MADRTSSHANWIDRLRWFITRPDLWIVALLGLLWVGFFWRILAVHSPDHQLLAVGDFTQHYYAFASYAADRFWQGQIPLWDPYNYAGMPFAANVQWATFYPPQLLAILIAGRGGFTINAYQVLVAVHYLLASLFGYAFLRVVFSKPAPALVGALIFAYGGYLTGYPMLQPGILFAAVWLPLALLFVHLSLTRERWRAVGCTLAGVTLAFSLFGGHPQTTLYIGYLLVAYLLFTGRRAGLRWRDLAWRLVLVGLAGGLVSLVQALPAQELGALSSRVEEFGYTAKANGFPLAQVFSLIWPQPGGVWSPLYVGMAGLVLAIGAAIRPRAEHHFWLAAAVVALFLAMGGNAILYDFFYLFAPGFSMFREQERAAIVVSFALAMLAAYQFDWLTDPPADEKAATQRRVFAWGAGGLAALALGVLLVYSLREHTLPAMLAADPVAGSLALVALVSAAAAGWAFWQTATQPAPGTSTAVLVFIIVMDLFTVGRHSTNFVADVAANRVQPPGGAELFQQGADVQYHIDGAYGLEGYGEYFRIPDIYGTGPFVLESTRQILDIPVDRFWEILAVKYITISGNLPPPGTPLELIATYANYSGQEYVIIRLTDARPMAHLVYDTRPASSRDEAYQIVRNDPSINVRETAVTVGVPTLDLSGQRPGGEQVTSFDMTVPEHVTMTVSTPEAALLLVAIPNYPGWQAWVDGSKVPVVDTDAGLIGVPVPAGQGQQVELRFRPWKVIGGGVVSALALVVIIGHAVVTWITVRNRGESPS